jgi:hypothetical protein
MVPPMMYTDLRVRTLSRFQFSGNLEDEMFAGTRNFSDVVTFIFMQQRANELEIICSNITENRFHMVRGWALV